MSSDLFSIRVTRLEGDLIEFATCPTWSVGINACFQSRAFVFLILNDGTPSGSPLDLFVTSTAVDLSSPHWYKKNLKNVIKKVWLIARDPFQDATAFLAARSELDPALASSDVAVASNAENELLRRFPRRSYQLRAQVKDSKWLEGISVGETWGTTAYDAWDADEAKTGYACRDDGTGRLVPKPVACAKSKNPVGVRR